MQHNFDFNKLFKEGINYQRLSDETLIRQMIDLRPEYDIIKSVSCTKTNQGIRYNSQRAYTSIGVTSKTSLEDYVRKVANFAVLVQTRDDWPIMEIKIESYALRRKLSQELQNIYKDRYLIFTDFSKGSSTFTVRKYKPKDQTNDGPNKKEEKLSPD